MSKKIMYFGDISKCLHVINFLRDKNNWQPIVLADKEGSNNQSDDKYFGSTYINVKDLEKSKFNYQNVGKFFPLNIELLNTLARYQLNFFSLIKDSNGWNFSLAQRKNFYFDNLKYWNSIINNFKPEVIVFFSPPDSPCSYSLYLICKYYYNLDVIFFSSIFLFNNTYFLCQNSAENQSSFISNIETNSNINSYKEIVENCLKKFKEENSKESTFVDLKNKKNNYYHNLKKILKLLFLKKAAFRKSNETWKKNNQHYHSDESRMNNLEYLLFLIKVENKKKKLFKLYESLSVLPNLKKKYIFVDNNFELNNSELIGMGIFENIFLALNMLSSIIPDDWAIYYRENFSNCSGKITNMNTIIKKNKYYFKKINSYKNISIISNFFPDKDLLDNSKAVISISGNSAWRSAIFGIPSITFSNNWYAACKNIHFVNTLDQLKAAFKKIGNKSNFDASEINKYLIRFLSNSISNLKSSNFEDALEKIKDSKNDTSFFSQEIYRNYKNYYPGKKLSDDNLS